MTVPVTPEVRDRLLELARTAGDAILKVYRSGDFGTETKPDDSPLTRADQASHRILTALDGYLGLPLLSEEGRIPEWDERQNWSAHWLIDPLDGTKEFVARNGEFTVNVALVADHRPVFGVVHVPVTGTTYLGGPGVGAVRVDSDGTVALHAARAHNGPAQVVVSRSHLDDATRTYLGTIGPHEAVATGSSVKLLRVAEGAADGYPRFGPTMEWDTAAAQAVVEGAGGTVVTQDGPLRYNRPNLRNPPFLAAAPWFASQHPLPVDAP